MTASTKLCIDLSDEVVDLAYEERIAEKKREKLKLKQARKKMLMVYHKDRAFDDVSLGPIDNEVKERRRRAFEKNAHNLMTVRRLAQLRKVGILSKQA